MKDIPNIFIKYLNKKEKEILNKILNGIRINIEDGLFLYNSSNIPFLSFLANYVKEKLHGDYVFFNRNFHIEPTNICVFDCKFCSYSKLYKHREKGWELSEKNIIDIINNYKNKNVTEVHIVGGVHPKMNIHFYANILRKIKKIIPNIHIKAFTAVEIEYMCRKAKLSYKEGLLYLKNNGLDSLPGGGAEIFDKEIRSKICNDKCSTEQWLEIHKTAHSIGLPTNATMLYGHIENYKHRLQHLQKLRELQDETNGFNAFIPLKFRNKNNQMENVPELPLIEDIKNYAVSRIFLDNFLHIKAYWPMIGRNIAQASLSFGVDDIDGTINDTTKIYSSAGAEEQHPAMTTEEIVHLIKSCNRIPIERDSVYNILKKYNEIEQTV